MEVQILEINQIGSAAENFEIAFKHNFFTETSHYVDYSNSEFYAEVLRLMCRRIKSVDLVLRVNL